MDNEPNNRGGPRYPKADWRLGLVLGLASAAFFHAAFLIPKCGFLTTGFLACLIVLTGMSNPRRAFGRGVYIGLLAYVPHLHFFWGVFVAGGGSLLLQVVGAIAVTALWFVLPIWLGLFLSVATYWRARLSARGFVLLVPVLWTGIEYFRGELYRLKFSWLSVGYAFSDQPSFWFVHGLGVYGVGFVLVLIVSLAVVAWKRSWQRSVATLAGGMAVMLMMRMLLFGVSMAPPGKEVAVAGIQMEFPKEAQVLRELDGLVADHPETELIVLSEYTFNKPLPESLKEWCQRNERHLIVGAIKRVGRTNFHNTAFVIGPTGEVVFEQAKSVPIQFFNDGLPAETQEVWQSPWGAIGICICYDLSYSRVTDAFIRKGAQAIISPTMDVASWGAYEHRLHTRIAPIRAAEHGIPVFRLASSGISQDVLRSGEVRQTAPFPGQGERLVGRLRLGPPGKLPLDRWLTPACVVLTFAAAVLAVVDGVRRRIIPKPGKAPLGQGDADEGRPDI